MSTRTLLLCGGSVLVLAAAMPPQGDDSVSFTEVEVRRLLQHSPLEGPPPDPTNRVADDPRAARLGQRLFLISLLCLALKLSCSWVCRWSS